MTTYTNKNSDLAYAPPGFDGCVFTDFISAHYHIVFDLQNEPRAFVTSTIRFKTTKAGKPLFDMAIDPDALDATLKSKNKSVKLTCKRVSPGPRLDQGGDVDLRCFDTELDPGEYTVQIRHRLDEMPAEPRHIRWEEGKVWCVFHMSDIKLPGRRQRFLDHYLPSNLEFDQFKISMRVEVKSTQVPHNLITNQGLQKNEENVWEFEHPDHFTTSFPWFHLVPQEDIVTRRFFYFRVAGMIYARAKSPTADRLRYFDRQIIDTLQTLEWGIGRFPYSYLTVFAHELLDGGGMEYAGATLSNFSSLRHELDHSYYARCIAPVNGNAGWIDEAIASWGDFDYFQRDIPPETDVIDRYLPGLAGHSPYSRVTDKRAYTLGRDFLAFLDHVFVHDAGISGGMRGFLRHYYDKMRMKKVRSNDFEAMVLKYYRENARDNKKPNLQKYFDQFINKRPDEEKAQLLGVKVISQPERRPLINRQRFEAHDISGSVLDQILLG